MEQVIYADILIFLNTVITFILLLTTSQFAGITPKASRLIIGSLVGGAYSLIILAPSLSLAAMLVTRAAMCLTLICIAFDPKKVKTFIRLFAVFILSNFLYAGILYAVFYLLSPGFMTVNNGFVYYNLSFFSVLFITAVIYILIIILRKTVFKNTNSDNIYEVEVLYKDNVLRAKALLDTGNNLTDPFNGKPVVIVGGTFAEQLTGEEFKNDTAEINTGLKAHYIPVSSVSGHKLLPCFSVDEIKIYKNDGVKVVASPVVAVTEDDLGGEEYSVLLNKELL